MGFPAEEVARRRMNVTVDDDGRNGRASKTFPTMMLAKGFYVKMFGEGRNPKIVWAE